MVSLAFHIAASSGSGGMWTFLFLLYVCLLCAHSVATLVDISSRSVYLLQILHIAPSHVTETERSYLVQDWNVSTYSKKENVQIPPHTEHVNAEQMRFWPFWFPLMGWWQSCQSRCSCWWSSRAQQMCYPAQVGWCLWPGNTRRQQSPWRFHRPRPPAWTGPGRTYRKVT